MAKYGADDVLLLVDGYNIGGDTIELSAVKEATLEESHGFGDTWVEQSAVGQNRGGVSHKGFLDDADNATIDALVHESGTQKPGTSRVLCALLEGNTQGKKAIAFRGAMESKVARNAARGELTKISAEYLNNGAVDEPKIIQVLAAQSAAGAGSSGSLDNAASSATGGTAYLQITSLTLGGYTSVTIKLMESSDNGVGDAWAQVGTAFVAATAIGAQAINIATGTTVERYLRAEITWNGAGAAQSVTYAVLFQRGQS